MPAAGGPATKIAHVSGAFVFAAALLGLLAAGPSSAQHAPRPQLDGPVRIEISSRLIEFFDSRDTTRRRFGALEFRGGLELTSSYKEFGGISSLRVTADGERFISVSDKGRWLRGRFIYRDGRLAGITDAEMAPILAVDGRPITARGWYDSESLAEDGGMLYVGLERVNRILRFDYAKFGLLAKGQNVTLPPEIARLPNNRGMECLVAIPKPLPGAGTLIAISERALDAAGHIKGFLIGGPHPGHFSVKRSDDFDVTDCAIGPAGDLFVLERKFSWTAGVALRVRMIPLANVLPGATVDGKALILADMGYQIDNMEGLALHRDKAGDIVLTMVSDDNFSFVQRTILLQFTLVSE
jgi:hypothetical protein